MTILLTNRCLIFEFYFQQSESKLPNLEADKMSLRQALTMERDSEIKTMIVKRMATRREKSVITAGLPSEPMASKHRLSIKTTRCLTSRDRFLTNTWSSNSPRKQINGTKLALSQLTTKKLPTTVKWTRRPKETDAKLPKLGNTKKARSPYSCNLKSLMAVQSRETTSRN